MEPMIAPWKEARRTPDTDWLTRFCWGACTLSGLLLVFVAALGAWYCRAIQTPSVRGAGSANIAIYCVHNDRVQSTFPPTPSNFPEGWRGVLWLDQSGAYGHSDLSAASAAPTLAVSFQQSVYDPAARTIYVGDSGASWTYANNDGGYAEIEQSRATGWAYTFELSEDYKFAQIVPSFVPFGGWLGRWTLPKWIVDYSIHKQDTSHAACPPPAGASKEQVRACAPWLRSSTFFLFFGAYVYPAFEIVNSAGQVLEPYYSQYLRFANSVCDPDADAARTYGINLAGCTYSGTSISDVG